MTKKQDLIKQISVNAINALLVEVSDNKNPTKWLSVAYNMVFNENSLLTEHWVKSINAWGENFYKSISVDESHVPQQGTIQNIGPLTILKVRKTKNSKDIRDLICIDENGWKYWVRFILGSYNTGNAKSFPKCGTKLFLKNAYIRQNKTGISFLGSPDKIVILIDEGGANDRVN